MIGGCTRVTVTEAGGGYSSSTLEEKELWTANGQRFLCMLNLNPDKVLEAQSGGSSTYCEEFLAM
jgi:hypothetical protein